MGSVQGLLSASEPSSAKMNQNLSQERLVRETIESNRVVLFSKSYCPFSSMAKETFRKLSIPVFVMELDGRQDGAKIQEVLGEMTGSKTVPRCFIDGEFIGGGTDIKRMFEQGELQKYFE